MFPYSFDSACTQFAIDQAPTPCRSLFSLGTTVPGGGCGSGTGDHIYRIESTAQMPTQIWSYPCTGMPQPTTKAFYALTEIAPTDFVAATVGP